MRYSLIKQTKFATYSGIVAFIYLICTLSCRNLYNPHNEFQFKEIVLCEGLDKNGEPNGIKETISSNTEVISLCIYVETERPFFFSIDWFGPNFSPQKVVKAEKSGWVVTTVANNNGFLPGEYTVRIHILKTQKATKTIEVIGEENQR